MTEEEAIEKIKRWKLEVDDEKDYAEYLEGWFYKDDEIAFDMAIEALQEQKWIPCSERLPEEKQVVLITNGKEHVRCGQYQGLAFRDSDPTKWWWKNKTIETVIAWMPLPKPYSDPTTKEGETE